MNSDGETCIVTTPASTIPCALAAPFQTHGSRALRNGLRYARNSTDPHHDLVIDYDCDRVITPGRSTTQQPAKADGIPTSSPPGNLSNSKIPVGEEAGRWRRLKKPRTSIPCAVKHGSVSSHDDVFPPSHLEDVRESKLPGDLARYAVTECILCSVAANKRYEMLATRARHPGWSRRAHDVASALNMV